VNTKNLFLVVYVIALTLHCGWSTIISSPVIATIFVAGIGAAIVSHRIETPLALSLLIAHMTIEWYWFAKHGWHYSGSQRALTTIHVLMDGAMLWHECHKHLSHTVRKIVVGLVVSCLAIIFIWNYTSGPELSPMLLRAYQGTAHAHGNVFLSTFIIGGIIGCALSHLTNGKQAHNQKESRTCS